MNCPTCHRAGYYPDPIARLAEMNRFRDAFEADYRRVHCPNCRKRISAAANSVDSSFNVPAVRMHCHHCDHRFDLPRLTQVARERR